MSPAEMINAQSQSAAELSTLEERVRGVLADEPVGVLDYLKYHNFSRQVYRAHKRRMCRYALFQEVAILITLQSARGCVEKVLTRIRTEVFSIQAPAEGSREGGATSLVSSTLLHFGKHPENLGRCFRPRSGWTFVSTRYMRQSLRHSIVFFYNSNAGY